jgi:hypothetical protein
MINWWTPAFKVHTFGSVSGDHVTVLLSNPDVTGMFHTIAVSARPPCAGTSVSTGWEIVESPFITNGLVIMPEVAGNEISPVGVGVGVALGVAVAVAVGVDVAVGVGVGGGLPTLRVICPRRALASRPRMINWWTPAFKVHTFGSVSGDQVTVLLSNPDVTGMFHTIAVLGSASIFMKKELLPSSGQFTMADIT